MSATRLLCVLLTIALASVFLACGEEKEASDATSSVTAKVAGASVTPSPITDTPSPKPTASPAPITLPPTEAPTPAPTAPPQAACHSSTRVLALIRMRATTTCAGGSGNGPYYTGPVRVVGADVFDLDRDGDGNGCE